MSSMVTAIIAAGRNWTIDHNAGEACDVANKVFTCIKIVWDRAESMFATVLTVITTIWKPGFNYKQSGSRPTVLLLRKNVTLVIKYAQFYGITSLMPGLRKW